MGTFRININEEAGTDLNVINKGIAGESLTAGDLCYLNTDGKYWKANANDIDKCSTELRVAKLDMDADETGPFIEQGSITGAGFTIGVRYYVASLAGQITTVELDSPNLVRYIGTASSETQLEFNPMDLSYNKSLQEQINAVVSDKNYELVFNTPIALLDINHQLNKNPSVTVLDSANNTVIGDIQYIDNNNIRLTFSSAFSGKVILN